MPTCAPAKRTLLYSRSSIIGSHRYGGIWLGDNHSSWEQLLANIQMMPSVQMCGFLYTGADLCGFAGDTTPDLALRWLEFGLFTPLMRNHAGAGTREQEYFRFADQLPALREMLRLRYALLPYLYSEFMKSALENTGYFRPLGFDWPADPEAREVQDQLLLGDGVMLAPVYTQNAAGRHVYLPEPMQLYCLRSAKDYDTEALPAGHHYVHCALNEVLLFVRPVMPCRWQSPLPAPPRWMSSPLPCWPARTPTAMPRTACTPMTARRWILNTTGTGPCWTPLTDPVFTAAPERLRFQGSCVLRTSDV